jgi:hypothetical protein
MTQSVETDRTLFEATGLAIHDQPAEGVCDAIEPLSEF